MRTKFKLEGLGQSTAGLETMAKSTRRGVLRRVAKSALEPFAALWPQYVGFRSGTLAKSGGTGTKLSRRQARLVDKQNEVEMAAGPGPLVQAIQDEFGNAHQPPRGGVRRAWAETRDEVLERTVEGLATETEKTARRLEAKAARLARKAGG